MIRAAIAGFGLAGRVFHAPLIASVDGFELAAIVERSGNLASERYPHARVYRKFDEMLADDSIGLVVIATPSGTHFNMAQQAIHAGKHVIVDKPVAVHSRQIAALHQLAQQHRVKLIPFHNRRWDGDFLTLQKLVRDGALGRLVHLESRMDRWSPGATRKPWKNEPAAGGGVLLDLGTHLVDQALVLFGKPESLCADVLRERDGDGANDSFTIRLRYPGGLRVNLGANALSSLPGPRFHARGTQGNYRKEGIDPQEAALSKITRIQDIQWGHEPPESWGVLQVDADGAMVGRPVETIAGDYRKFYAGVRDALTGNAELPVNAHDAFSVARVLEWAEESSTSRCEIKCDWSAEWTES